MKVETENNLLLIIDMQYDFCHPNGALYVPGSENDIKRIGDFIQHNIAQLDHIVLTQDQHEILDISHSKFWVDRNGMHPDVFTQISFNDVLNGIWRSTVYEAWAKSYIEQLELEGEYPHVIWPEHCLVGSKGAEIVEELLEALWRWTASGRSFSIIQKGLNPLTEHFGALRANVPVDYETSTNMELVDCLQQFNHIYIAGEARSHCVANTVKQMVEIDGLASKMIILEDCMSNVPGFENLADEIFAHAKEAGVKFLKTK